jgi:hypothetical protein
MDKAEIIELNKHLSRELLNAGGRLLLDPVCIRKV